MAWEELQRRWQVLHREVPESREAKGMWHRQATVLAMVFSFLLSGGQGGLPRPCGFCRRPHTHAGSGPGMLVQPAPATLRGADVELLLPGAQGRAGARLQGVAGQRRYATEWSGRRVVFTGSSGRSAPEDLLLDQGALPGPITPAEGRYFSGGAENGGGAKKGSFLTLAKRGLTYVDE